MYKEDLALNNLQWLTCHKWVYGISTIVGYFISTIVGYGISTNNGWYAIKPNPTKSYIIYMYKEDLALNNL